MLRLADQIVVMSTAQKSMFDSVRDRVTVIYNAIVPLPIDSDDAVALESCAGAPRIAVIGRLSPEKGVDIFLQACALLARNSFPFQAVIIGTGPDELALKTLARQLSLGEHVTFAGQRTITGSLYAALDLIVIPSRTEGLPNVLLEAIGCGVPVVSTSVGAVPDVLGGTNAGCIVPVEDPAALASAIRGMLEKRHDPAMRQDQEKLTKRFTLDARGRALQELYTKVLSSTDSR
jgi:glycosyltransferase involved in cell wall biosynthesis